LQARLVEARGHHHRMPLAELETPRLRLRPLTLDDAAFVLELLNEPGWLQFIGDRGVRTPEAARGYLAAGPLAMYARHGLGLLAILRKTDGAVLGLCGLLQRDTLPHPDLGYALLARFHGQGYAREAAAAVLAHARDGLKLRRILALTALENPRSIRLLEHLGFRFERVIAFKGEVPDTRLFALGG
jgi:RimJ/RimL family protein N-acetyltransferase